MIDMGAVTFSIDRRLIQCLQEHLPFDVFVETGTFRGETVEAVLPYFKQIYSVELSPVYYEEARQKFATHPQVSLIQGDSAQALETVLKTTQDRSVVFWLDAHWCVANATAGELSQCPLLAELKAINHLNENSMIIIDDARLFLATPQAPHEITNWPTLHEIMQTLFLLSPHHQVSIVNDCILFFPSSLIEVVKQFSHVHGVDWLDISNRCKDSEALLVKVCQENDMFHNMGVWKRMRGILGYVKRSYFQ